MVRCIDCFTYQIMMGIPRKCNGKIILDPTREIPCKYFNPLRKIKNNNKEISKLDLKKVIELADRQRSEIVLCLLGNPGIGKTQSVYEFAKEHGRNVVEIIASQIMPNEVSGITMPVEKTHSMEVFDHARLSSLKDGDILFFDELLAAAPTTLSACLTLIQERRMMSGKMLPDVLIIAAANKLASPGQVPLSIRQRFMFYECEWNASEWAMHIRTTMGISPITDLVNNIQSTGDSSYNVLTPRSATKLLGWMKSCEDEAQQSIVLSVIENMYNSSIKNIFERQFMKKDEKRQILDAVYKVNPSLRLTNVYDTAQDADYNDLAFEDNVDPVSGEHTVRIMNKAHTYEEAHAKPMVGKSLEDCSVEELYGILSIMPGWEDVAKELAKTDFEDPNAFKF